MTISRRGFLKGLAAIVPTAALLKVTEDAPVQIKPIPPKFSVTEEMNDDFFNASSMEETYRNCLRLIKPQRIICHPGTEETARKLLEGI